MIAPAPASASRPASHPANRDDTAVLRLTLKRNIETALANRRLDSDFEIWLRGHCGVHGGTLAATATNGWGPHQSDLMVHGVTGTGKTVEKAALDWIRNASIAAGKGR